MHASQLLPASRVGYRFTILRAPTTRTLLQLSPCPPVHGVSLFYLYLIRTCSMMSEISARGPQSVGLSLKAIHCGLGLYEALSWAVQYARIMYRCST